MQFVSGEGFEAWAHSQRATYWREDELTPEQRPLMDNWRRDRFIRPRVSDTDWPRIAVVVCSGPSLTEHDCSDAAGADCVIAVNTSWERVPWADFLYVNDERWWEYRGTEDNRIVEPGQLYHEAVRDHFQGRTFCGQINGLRKGYADEHVATEFSRPGFRPVGHHLICGGNNSGHTAINLAAKIGFANVIVLGMDMQGGHWHEDHPHAAWCREMGQKATDAPAASGPRNRWVANMDELAAEARRQGYQVINASRETAVRSLPRMPIKDALLHLREHGSRRWMPAIEWCQTDTERMQAKAWRRRMGWENV